MLSDGRRRCQHTGRRHQIRQEGRRVHQRDAVIHAARRRLPEINASVFAAPKRPEHRGHQRVRLHVGEELDVLDLPGHDGP